MKYLESVKEDRQQSMDALKELVALPKLETRYARFAQIAIKKEINWLMRSIHDMNITIKLEEKKNEIK
ncbi:TPA: hypothetical protein QCU24_002956 [Bacillus cereus]|uniref:Uncharacterized protein n=1 Tax=Bacillus phage vB_BtS_BMBtp2 TaxID=2884431 RepID=K4LP06_9CAUD|nr:MULTISPECIES: hypothetical protein [Bacillus]YP_007236370.1 hypothetical protein ISGA_12 [Bacillus phage vB_BtS_BMBtp2]HDR6245218.1 hypothetical protein [Bacillus cereus]AFV15405.1 hypothetical protein ISGA_12 [Bacillus phage vB_BtS_BMBtp2]AJQ58643.1 hypothetical protein SD98_10145 [Bacillus thuringiensis serovar morrisoni]MED3098641.1 hypothetical protein [Bacillus thuringiensis]MRA95341.1 hypothetical protein [Bacillus thuringiensis]